MSPISFSSNYADNNQILNKNLNAPEKILRGKIILVRCTQVH